MKEVKHTVLLAEAGRWGMAVGRTKVNRGCYYVGMEEEHGQGAVAPCEEWPQNKRVRSARSAFERHECVVAVAKCGQ